ncbi:transglycosylase SLT domain-containing protein [Nocardia sp. NEAU-G5]|uniref:Transglycosylase SLT domain-containing protein n=2 Tax=Nocardia albiluteola TaxID=2842303 RepID=A0ABS6B1A8_9NOCA|nr:transglycosylase SLT domain-containing protein [Nocardia albiluteola]
MLAQVNTESGGNPTAVNLWDSNAQAGHPSQGLLQTIPSTFATWRDPSLPNDINDPAANMAAALRYYRANYGNDLSTEWGHGHGYDDGGIASGIGLMLKQTLKPERVLSPKQTETFDSALPLLESINNSAWSPNRIDSSSLSPAAAPQSAGAGRTFAPTINARVASVSDLADLVERQAQKDAIGLMAAMP